MISLSSLSAVRARLTCTRIAPRALPACFLMTALAAWLVASNASAAIVQWDNGGADGNWDLDAGWSPTGEPTADDDARVDNDATVTIDALDEVANRFRLGSSNASDIGTLHISGGSLSIAGTASTEGFIQIGQFGTGDVVQSGGMVNAQRSDDATSGIDDATFTLGSGAGSHGSYDLSSGTLNVLDGRAAIGSSGHGEFTQTGGAVNMDYLIIGGTFNSSGPQDSATGNYNMSGGVLNILQDDDQAFIGGGMDSNNDGDPNSEGDSLADDIFNFSGGEIFLAGDRLGSLGFDEDNLWFQPDAPAGWLYTEELTGDGRTRLFFAQDAAAVPEPATWLTVCLGGLLVVGAGLRRRLRDALPCGDC